MGLPECDSCSFGCCRSRRKKAIQKQARKRLRWLKETASAIYTAGASCPVPTPGRDTFRPTRHWHAGKGIGPWPKSVAFIWCPQAWVKAPWRAADGMDCDAAAPEHSKCQSETVPH